MEGSLEVGAAGLQEGCCVQGEVVMYHELEGQSRRCGKGECVQVAERKGRCQDTLRQSLS